MSSENNSKDKVIFISQKDFWGEIKDSYVEEKANTSPTEIYPDINPGPTNLDGSVNFDCHCVGHLVASPCGYQFRKAIICQKSASEKEMENGACGEQLISFMECAMRTQCFKTNDEAKP